MVYGSEDKKTKKFTGVKTLVFLMSGSGSIGFQENKNLKTLLKTGFKHLKAAHPSNTRLNLFTI